MRNLWTDAERWEWYAAGDRTVAPPAAVAASAPNLPDRVLWELGLTVLAPLVAAVLASVALA